MSYIEERVKIEGEVTLGATVTHWDDSEKRPAIVIIMGTGKLDRDGNGGGINMEMYSNLAKEFSDWGFVTVRYDKRGTHESTGNFNHTGLLDLVEDATTVVRYISSQPYVDPSKVIVCGHSEGAIIATILSQKADVAGMILLGGAATSLKDALYYQNNLVADQAQNMTGLKGALLRKTATREKNIEKVDKLFSKAEGTDKDTMLYQGMPMPAKWFREHDLYSSDVLIGILRNYGKPILAITGTADLSMDYRRLDIIRDIPQVECYAPENVNHILREIDDDNLLINVKKQYIRLAKLPMHEGAVQKIHEWLDRFNRSGRNPFIYL